MATVRLEDVTQGLRACFKVLSKIQMPVAYMDVETRAQTEELPTPGEEGKKSQVRRFTLIVLRVNMFFKTDCGLS